MKGRGYTPRQLLHLGGTARLQMEQGKLQPGERRIVGQAAGREVAPYLLQAGDRLLPLRVPT
jgi:hypothetical protein